MPNPKFIPHHNFHGAVGKSERYVQALRAEYKRPEPKWSEGQLVVITNSSKMGMVWEDPTYLTHSQTMQYRVKTAKAVEVLPEDALEDGGHLLARGLGNWVQSRLEAEKGEWDWYGR